MQDKVRSILIAAVEAGRHGAPLAHRPSKRSPKANPNCPWRSSASTVWRGWNSASRWSSNPGRNWGLTTLRGWSICATSRHGCARDFDHARCPVDYAALSAGCRTENEFRRLHIGLEDTLAPAELREIKKLIDTKTKMRQVKLDGALQNSAHLCLKRRRPISVMSGFADDAVSGPASEVAKKGLLIAFSGDARRLMLPVCVFLQLIESRRWDVVVKKTGRQILSAGVG